MELILGAVVSLIVQGLKKKFIISEYVTLLVVLTISIAASVAYTTLVAVGMWETVAQVLITAGAFYSFVLARFEKGTVLSKAIGNG